MLGAPLVAAVALLFVPADRRTLIRAVSVTATAISLWFALRVFLGFDSVLADADGLRFRQQIPWVPALGISYHVAVDGLNVGLVVMAAVVAFAAACVSSDIRSGEKEYHILLLCMAAGVLGAFASMDLFFFYCFHELALVPTFIMLGVWGRGERRDYAAFQITIYLSAGALLALVGLLALYFQLPAASRSFDLARMVAHFQGMPMALAAQQAVLPLLLFGFGILVSLWPFHTWAPLGYSTAPTATAMVHAGVLKKFGMYGLIRLALPVLPEALREWAPWIGLLGLGNLVYCGWVAMRQRDLGGLFANSSVAHMGFCFLGLASQSVLGITGAVLVMIAHGLLAALSFALVGVLHSELKTTRMDDLGGLLQQAPFMGGCLMIALLAGCGLPGFANFVGELMVLFGAWQALPWIAVAGAWAGLVIGAVYMLRAARDVLHGPVSARCATSGLALSAGRRLPFVVLVAGLVILGCFPRLITDKIEPDAERLLGAKVSAVRAVAAAAQQR
jgi:NADH-quinone oxidoreductase subunit M